MPGAGAGYGRGMIPAALVFLGAGLGGVLRHGVNLVSLALVGSGFPAGTLAINLAGSFAMGLVAGWFALHAGEGVSQGLRLFLTTGVLGGFTTFSAFSLDAALLWQRGDAGAAAFYVIASVAGSIGALFAGLALVRGLS